MEICNICRKRHKKIYYNEATCPVCELVEKIDDLEQVIINLQKTITTLEEQVAAK